MDSTSHGIGMLGLLHVQYSRNYCYTYVHMSSTDLQYHRIELHLKWFQHSDFLISATDYHNERGKKDQTKLKSF